MKDSEHLRRFLGLVWVTRKQASKVLGITISGLRTLEKRGVLHPVEAQKANGFTGRKYGSGRQPQIVYQAEELERALEQKEFAHRHAGAFAAAAFAAFDRGLSTVETVILLRLPPARVEEFHVAYRRAKNELVVPGTAVEEMRGLGFDVTAANFVATVERLLEALRNARRRSA